MSKVRRPYEVLPHIQDEQGETTLAASFTPNNGIRITLSLDEDNFIHCTEFDFTREQAELIGWALIRWAFASDILASYAEFLQDQE